MLRTLIVALIAFLPMGHAFAIDGISSQPSPHSVPETIHRLEAVMAERGVTLFAKIDHGAEAAKVGLQLAPAQVLIFGNPRAGTPLMQAAPAIALDLPLRVLVQEDAAGKVFVSYQTPAFLQQRYGLTADQAKALRAVEALVAAALK
jgi:uncharacterized protein (DUF302 family)